MWGCISRFIVVCLFPLQLDFSMFLVHPKNCIPPWFVNNPQLVEGKAFPLKAPKNLYFEGWGRGCPKEISRIFHFGVGWMQCEALIVDITNIRLSWWKFDSFSSLRSRSLAVHCWCSFTNPYYDFLVGEMQIHVACADIFNIRTYSMKLSSFTTSKKCWSSDPTSGKCFWEYWWKDFH